MFSVRLLLVTLLLYVGACFPYTYEHDSAAHANQYDELCYGFDPYALHMLPSWVINHDDTYYQLPVRPQCVYMKYYEFHPKHAPAGTLYRGRDILGISITIKSSWHHRKNYDRTFRPLKLGRGRLMIANDKYILIFSAFSDAHHNLQPLAWRLTKKAITYFKMH